MKLESKFNVGDKVLAIEYLSRHDLFNRSHGGFFISKDTIREIRFTSTIDYIMMDSNKSISEENVFALDDTRKCVDKVIELIENKEKGE